MKNVRKLGFLFVLTAALLLEGCAKTDQDQTEGNSRTEESQTWEDQGEQDSAAEGGDQVTSDEALAGVSFEGVDLEGDLVSSDIFSETKLTMVNVWATYCNPCLREMPDLGELGKEYDSGEFQIIGVISDVMVMEDGRVDEKSLEYARELIEQTGADYTHLLLNRSLYEALLSDVSAVPTTFFLDENGVVLDTVIGAMDKSAWEEKIHGLLEEQ